MGCKLSSMGWLGRVGLAIVCFSAYSSMLGGRTVAAQQVTSTLPVQSAHDSFYEMFGLHWGFRLGGPNGGVFFDNGGFGGVAPGFGGFDPNGAARFGFARGGTNGGFFMDFMAAQGSDRSFVSSAPMITMPNGGTGGIWSTSITPFVTGWVPVVGQNPQIGPPLRPLEERLSRLRSGETPGVRPPLTNANIATASPSGAAIPISRRAPAPSAARNNPSVANTTAADANSGDANASGASNAKAAVDAGSSAVRGDLSVAEIRQQQADEDAAREAEINSLVAQAEAAVADAKPGVARIFYQQASRLATGNRQQTLAAKARELQTRR